MPGTDLLLIDGGAKARRRGPRGQDVSPEQIESFLVTLGDTCNVALSARKAGFSQSWAYRLRKRDASFRAGWAEAVREGYAKLELVLLERAMKGTPKPIMRRGSEWAVAAHGPSEPFVLVEARALKGISATASMIGTGMTVTAYGPGNDGQEPVVTRIVQGEAARPLSPAQLRGNVRADGSLELNWTRRSRRGFAWIDAVDVPTDPDLSDYRVAIAGSAATADYSVTEPQLVVSAAELASLGTGPLTITARQVGSIGLSRPTTIIINL